MVILSEKVSFSKNSYLFNKIVHVLNFVPNRSNIGSSKTNYLYADITFTSGVAVN